MGTVLAAGTVALRRRGRVREVAVVHRPRYDDWTLPKGKLEPAESLPECAVRETREEAGLRVRLEVPLDVVRYRLPRGEKKVVAYWRAAVVADEGLEPTDEVDRVRWVDVDAGLRRLSFARDRRAVRQAVELPTTTAVALARHGKAVGRQQWGDAPDVLRPLERRGRQQARDLVGPLLAYGIDDLRSSAGTRCMQTFEPAARRVRAPLLAYDVLTEEAAAERPELATVLLESLARRASRERRPVAVCGHRPVLPLMFVGLGVAPRPMGTGDLVITHVAPDGRTVAVEDVPARR